MAAITLQFEGFEEMKSFARKLIQGEDGGQPVTPETKSVPEKKQKAEPVAAAKPEPDTEGLEEVADTEEASYTLEDVRAKLAALNKSGKREAVQALIASYGAGKLTEIEESNYADLMQKAGEL